MRRRTSHKRTYNLAEWQRIVVPGRRPKRAVVGPGRVKVRPRHVDAAQIVDLRPSLMYLTSPELTTSDDVTVKVSATATVRVVDPVAAVRGTASAQTFILERALVALADVVRATTVDELTALRESAGARVLAEIHHLDACGVEMVSFEIRDVVLPRERNRLVSRGFLASESPAVRGLANAAKRSSESPALFQLRLLQHLDRTHG